MELKKHQPVPFRPCLEGLGIPEYIEKCIKACWHEEPELRPDIRYVRVRLKEMQVRVCCGYFHSSSDNMCFEKLTTSRYFDSIKLHSLGWSEAQHLRQHAGHHGEVRLQPRGTRAGKNEPTHGGEEEDRSSSPQNVAQVRMRSHVSSSASINLSLKGL